MDKEGQLEHEQTRRVLRECAYALQLALRHMLLTRQASPLTLRGPPGLA